VRILSIDPGEKHLGLAISDPSGLVATPLGILRHISRPVDAAAIAQIASEHGAELIIVGQALDADNLPTAGSRRSARLAAAIRSQTSLPVRLWDESGTTQAARAARLAAGARRRDRAGHLDDIAAAVLLQSYLADNPGDSKSDFNPGT
jgi:putative Holliday junction resolvase